MTLELASRISFAAMALAAVVLTWVPTVSTGLA